jgi:hypothetical protein
MNSLTDPPPDESNTRPIESAQLPRRMGFWFWFCVWFWLLLLLGPVILGLLKPVIFGGDSGHRASVEAFGNIKEIALALCAFDQDYGQYPNADTIEAVRKKTDTLLPLGTNTSNDYFRQLIAAECIDDEKCFFARIRENSRMPDNRMNGAQALEKGECGFSYIIGPDSSGKPPQPLLVTPLIPGTDRFDPKPFAGKAVIFRTDLSTTIEPIDKHGHVLDAAGNNLLDPSNPVWAGKPPHIVWPE